jgi:hypothetical protein
MSDNHKRFGSGKMNQMIKKSENSDPVKQFRSNSSISAQEFIETYMEVYRAGGTNKDLATKLGVKLQQVYPLRDRTNKILESENTQLPPLIPVDRKYGSGLNTQELAELVRKELASDAEQLANMSRPDIHRIHR